MYMRGCEKKESAIISPRHRPQAALAAEFTGGIQGIDGFQLVSGKRDLQRSHVVLQLIQSSRADDRAGYAGDLQTPCDGELAGGNAVGIGEFVHAFHQRPLAGWKIALSLS